jgi:hypothetical protein
MTTRTVRLSRTTAQKLKVEAARRGLSMLDALESAASAWMKTPAVSLDKHATEHRSRPQRRKSA